MLKYVALIAPLAVCIAFPRHKLNDSRSEKVVGGQNATIEELPYNCQFEWFGFYICGCVIMREDIILTAAQCTDGTSVDDLIVRLGTTLLSSGGETFQPSEFFQHHDFSLSTLDYDLSLVRLSSNITFNTAIQPIVLPTQDQQWPEGTKGVLSGWGATSMGGVPSEWLLKVVDIPVVEPLKCQQYYEEFPLNVTERMLCAGSLEGGFNSCQGDPGSPFVIDNVLAGLASWSNGCALPGYPGINTNVSHFINYINETIGIY